MSATTTIEARPCICQRCGSEFASWIKLPYCAECAEALYAANAEQACLDALAARCRDFWDGIPPLYRQTDKARLAPPLRSAIESYEYGPMGVGFIGSAGAGKTRAAVLILAGLMEQGMSTLYLPATELSAAAAGAFSDDPKEKERCREILRKSRKVKALLIDDLGKGRLTERAESELYDILEHRTGHLLPTFWTANSEAKGLRSMLSRDRADALIRRIGREFCKHVVL